MNVPVLRWDGFYDEERETMRPERRAELHRELLRETVRYAYENAPGVRRKMEEAGVRPEDVKEIRDLAKIPLTRKAELKHLQKAEPPFGGLAAVAPEKIRRIYVSPCPTYDPEGRGKTHWRWEKAFFAAGFREGDIVQNTFSYHLSPAGLMFEEALLNIGCTVVPAGVGNTELQAQVMKELSVTGYTAGDLLLSDALIRGALDGLNIVAEGTRGLDMLVIVGLPVAHGNCLFNCAAVLKGGRALGVVPKTNLPNYQEFYELRHFAPGFPELRTLSLLGGDVPFSRNLIFRAREMPEFSVALEICEDLWAPNPTGIQHALAGAMILVNPSASDALAGKRHYRKLLVESQSARLAAGYVYAGAGPDESTQDVVFAGHSMLYEYGTRLSESEPFARGLIYGDVDVRFLAGERRAANGFRDRADEHFEVPFSTELRRLELRRYIDPAPFVPDDPEHLSERAEEIL